MAIHHFEYWSSKSVNVAVINGCQCEVSFYCSLSVSCCSSKGESHQANGSPTQKITTNAGERMPAQPGTPKPEQRAE